MKDKIIARFRAKYPNVNLTKKRLDEISARLESKITDENEIDAKLDDLNEIITFTEIAKQDDRLVQLEALKLDKKPTDPPTPPIDPLKTTDDEIMPAWAKALVDRSTELEQQLAGFNKEKTVLNRKDQLATALKDADEIYRNKALKDFQRMNFENDEAFTEYVAEATEDLKTFTQKFSDAGLAGDRPRSAFGSAKVGEAEVSQGVKTYLENQKAAEKKTA
jgi:hypothetical protein